MKIILKITSKKQQFKKIDEKRLSSELMTILQMNKAIKPMLEEMNNSISKCNPNRYTKYFENDDNGDCSDDLSGQIPSPCIIFVLDL